jgi:hypothetical protein
MMREALSYGKDVNVPTPPEHNDELDAAVEAGPPRQTPPQQQKYQAKGQEGDNLLEDAVDVVADRVDLGGCPSA